LIKKNGFPNNKLPIEVAGWAGAVTGSMTCLEMTYWIVWTSKGGINGEFFNTEEK
jgi:hypothetical protein